MVYEAGSFNPRNANHMSMSKEWMANYQKEWMRNRRASFLSGKRCSRRKCRLPATKISYKNIKLKKRLSWSLTHEKLKEEVKNVVVFCAVHGREAWIRNMKKALPKHNRHGTYSMYKRMKPYVPNVNNGPANFGHRNKETASRVAKTPMLRNGSFGTVTCNICGTEVTKKSPQQTKCSRSDSPVCNTYYMARYAHSKFKPGTPYKTYAEYAAKKERLAAR